MTTSTIQHDIVSRRKPESNGDSVMRHAFYLESQGQPLFAWLHQSAAPHLMSHGVILCSPIGYEHLHTQRSLRHLADRLAQEGLATLRFDWHGTGDSPGTDDDDQRVDTWQANLRDAVRWMRLEMGCQKISLIGLRLGATLAAHTDIEGGVENLVLWWPVVKGRAYVREMKALSLTSECPRPPGNSDANEIEAGGFVLSQQTADQIGRLDLGSVHPTCRQAVIVTRRELTPDNCWSDRWTATGISVKSISLPGYAEMMVEPHRNQVPEEAIAQIIDQLNVTDSVDHQQNSGKKEVSRVFIPRLNSERSELTPLSNLASVGNCRSDDVTAPDAAEDSQKKAPVWAAGRTNSQWPYSPTACLTCQPFRESAIQIPLSGCCAQCLNSPTNLRPHLFAIVTEPTTPVLPSSPTVVLLNAGSSSRIGPGRLNVQLARHLAAQGIRTVRLDLSGLGDSITDSSERENDPYPDTTFRDIDFAIRDLEQRFQTQRIVLMGLCSGAYAAFQSAVQLPHKSLVEAVLINPLTFFWREGMSFETAPTKQLLSMHYYMNSAINPSKWLKLLSGQSKIGISGALKLVARRWKLIKISDESGRQQQRVATKRVFSHPLEEDLAGDLERVNQAGRRLAMFFSTSDPGYSILNFHARRKANDLRAAGKLSVEFIDRADHTFSNRASRTALITAIFAHLRRRYL